MYKNEFEIFTAINGFEGLKIVENENIDLIISDQSMPGMTGVEFFEKVLKINPRPHRILLTAYNDIEALAEAINRGKILQYVNKPWNKEGLRKIMKNAIVEFNLKLENEILTEKLKEKTIELQSLLEKKTTLLDELEESRAKIQIEKERFNTILEFSPIPILVVDERNKITFINHKFIQTFGYTLNEIPHFLDWYYVAYPEEESRKTVISQWNKRKKTHLENGSITEPFESIIRCKNQTDKVIQIHSSSFEKNTVIAFNDLTQIRHLEEDISFRVKMEDELRKAKKIADEASKSKSDFIASMSHEIRTPLNSIIGFTDMLETDLKDSPSIEYIKSIQNGAKTLLSLINDILDFSKIEAGKVSLTYKPFDIRMLIKEIVDVFRFKIQEKNLSLLTEIDENISFNIVLDELRVKQILLNLINNAIKFTEKGHVKIYVKAENIRSQYTDLSIAVEDTGIGIPKNKQEKIFQTFEQVENLDNKRYEGTGLGLSISRNLASLMNGTIILESKARKGSTFTVFLKEVNTQQKNPDKTTTKKKKPPILSFRKASILLIDDNPNNIRILKLRLQKYNFNILEAKSGMEALGRLKEEEPELIFLDLNMPDLDGYDTLQQIKSNEAYKHIPVIAMTAYPLKYKEEIARSSGFVDYVSIPVSYSRLEDILKSFIEYSFVKEENEKKETAEINLVPINDETKDLSELIKELKTHCLPLVEKMSKIRPKDLLAQLSILLIEYGTKHKHMASKNYGEKIEHAMKTFNVEQEKILIRQFPSFLKQLEENQSKMPRSHE